MHLSRWKSRQRTVCYVKTKTKKRRKKKQKKFMNEKKPNFIKRALMNKPCRKSRYREGSTCTLELVTSKQPKNASVGYRP